MIDFINVSKSYAGQDIITDASLKINQGERIGIVGPNGAGKSTLFGLITGGCGPDKGTVSVPSAARIGYLHQHIDEGSVSRRLLDFSSDALPELQQVHDEIETLEKQIPERGDKSGILQKIGLLQTRYEALGGYTIRKRTEAVLGGLGFSSDDFSRKLESFSGGWQMRAALARVLVAEPDIMLLDEPSNYLDLPAVEWLQRFLKNFHGTLLLISHDRYLLRTLTDLTVEINNGFVTRYPGNYDFYERERELRMKTLASAKKNQDKKKEQLERFIERFRAKNTKASQAASKMKVLDKMEDIRLPGTLGYSGTLAIPDPPHSGAEIMRLEGVGFSYGAENSFRLDDISLRIERGAKIAICGYNGTGKTTLLKLIAGRLNPSSGRRVPGHKVVIGYQAQEFGEILPSEQTVFDVVRNAAAEGVDYKRIRGILGAFGFPGDTVDKQCGVLSGGEKIRLCFAAIFANPPNFLVLDEPTTHLDIHAREALQDALKQYQGTVCLVSHDIEFVRGTASRIIEMTPPGIRFYHGNYDYFTEKRQALGSAPANETDVKEKKSGTKKQKRKENAARREAMNREIRVFEKEAAGLERKIEFLEQEKSDIVSRIENNEQDIDFYAVNKRLVDIEEDISGLTLKWEAAALKVEEIRIKYST